MKTTINSITWLCCVILLLVSCSKPDDCDTQKDDSPCYAGTSTGDKLLIVETRINGNTSSLHEYDNQNRTTAISTYEPDGAQALLTTYTYADHDFPISVRGKNKDGDVVVKKYVYGSNGRPVSAVATIISDPESIPLDYQYVYSKNRLIETIIPRRENEPILVNTYLYDEKGNLLSLETAGDGLWYSTVEQGSFDDKHSNYLHGNPEAWMFPGVNNHQTIRSKSRLLGIFSDQKYKYTYNNVGYPVKAEIYDNLSGGALIETVEYFYKEAI